jgi:TPR repeat protein
MRILLCLLAVVAAAQGSEASGLRAYRAHDYARAFAIWSADALSGDRESQFHLALLYLDGEGVAKDPAEARVWMRSAAQRGSEAAQFELGWFLADGIGGAPDPVEARTWYERAAAHGHRRAMNELGRLCLKGRGGPVDYLRAYQLFRQASLTDTAAMFNVGYMHEHGLGRAVDLVEAAAWYSLAAEHREPGAAEDRDRLLARLSPADRERVPARLLRIGFARFRADLWENGAYYVAVVNNLWVFVSGSVFLIGLLWRRLRATSRTPAR